MSADWVRADWPAPRGIVAGVTTRLGGASSGSYASLNLAAHVGDTLKRVRLNRSQFLAMCGLPGEPRWLEQMHGTRVVHAEALSAKNGPPQADAIVTKHSAVVCAVLTADCLPILLCTADGGEIAAAHAGWRGLANGIIAAAVDSMSNPANNLLAWLGPAISQPAYEVGKEVRAVFLAADPDSADCFVANGHGRWQADLCGLARRRLAAAGVTEVYGGGFCTYADQERFFSYRRDGQCGRMASFIFRRN